MVRFDLLFLTFSLSFGSVGFPFEDGMVTEARNR
jgi:hypothetical protein